MLKGPLENQNITFHAIAPLLHHSNTPNATELFRLLISFFSINDLALNLDES